MTSKYLNADIHAALFVDFDNIFLSLQNIDQQAADEFANNPDRWLAWLEEQMPSTSANIGQRRILIRRCYLNPQSFAKFRPFFILSAFEVIDCPPLTSRGKTSTDIHMVMDILDTLNSNPHIQEFIILSGDADFTPVLLRIRKHGCYSTALSVGYVSPAYKASCDYVLPQEVFMRDGLGIGELDEDLENDIPAAPINHHSAKLLNEMADRLYAAAVVVPNGIEASELPEIYKDFDEFRQGSHWLGYKSLRRLTDILVNQRGDLTIIEADPWRVKAASLVEKQVETAEHIPDPRFKEIKAAVSGWISNIVGTSKSAVPMASLAASVNHRFGLSQNNWLGSESFKNFLGEIDLNPLKVSFDSPGYIYDPNRHTLPESEESSKPIEPLDNFSLQYPDIAHLARKIHQLTDMPYLSPQHYALLLAEIARTIDESGYHMTRVSKTVRDRCVERGAPISRTHVNFALIGIGYAGHRLGQNTEEAEVLGNFLIKNAIDLCRRAQYELNNEERELLNEWVLGSL
jgi:hypothetical protein